MDAKQAFKELERFAAARARGATVVLELPSNANHLTYRDPETSCLGMDARTFQAGWTIKEIIEPTVTRPWNAEDAKKHVGFSIRHTGVKDDVYTLNQATHCKPLCDFSFSEYATPIPGTDPAKWDWKPCTVEVPASEPVKAFDALAAVKALRSDVRMSPGACSCPGARFARESIDAILKSAEQS